MTTPLFHRARTWIERLPPAVELGLVLLLTSVPSLISVLLGSSSTEIYVTSGRVIRDLGWEMLVGGGLAFLLVLRGWPLRELIARPKWRDLRDGTWLLGALVLVVGVMALALAAFFFARGIRPGFTKVTFTNNAPFLLLLFALFNPVFEELLWLGYWYRKVEPRSPALAATVSIGLRMVAHLWKGLLGAATVFPIGAAFTLFYVRKRRLWPIILAHAVFDVVSVFGLIHARR